MRLFAMSGYALAACLMVAFYICHAQTRGVEQELRIVAEQRAAAAQARHLLDWEWTYLTNPERLANLTGVLLSDMQPVGGKQITPTLQRLPSFAVADNTTAAQEEPYRMARALPQLYGALDFRQ